MPIDLQPVNMAEGSGMRLRPQSRVGYPQQLLVLQGNSSLLQQAAQRLTAHKDAASPVVMGNEEHRFLIPDQLREVQYSPSALVLDPPGATPLPPSRWSRCRRHRTRPTGTGCDTGRFARCPCTSPVA